MSSDPSICSLHRRNRPQVGVCHLCLKDRLLRLSLSDSSGPSFLSSSRSSFDSSDNTTSSAAAAAGENTTTTSGATNSKPPTGKLGTIFSLMESDNEELAARIEEEEQSDRVGAGEISAPSQMLRSKSVSQWFTQPPRRSTNTKDSPFVRVIGTDPVDAKSNGIHSPLVSASASATPVVHHHHHNHNHQPQSSSKSKNGSLSWISSLFKLGKRKKKSSNNGPVETNFFPPEAWNDEFQAEVTDRDRLWRSRSVSSGRVIKRSFTPLVVGAEDPVVSVTGIEPAPPPPTTTTTTTGIEPPSRVSSLIAVDMREAASKVHQMVPGDVAGDKSYVAVPARASVASLMDIDRKYVESTTCAAPSPSLLQRSRSTGGWRRKIRSDSPSSVLLPPTNPAATPGNEWSFYLTPLRTFSRNRSSRHAR